MKSWTLLMGALFALVLGSAAWAQSGSGEELTTMAPVIGGAAPAAEAPAEPVPEQAAAEIEEALVADEGSVPAAEPEAVPVVAEAPMPVAETALAPAPGSESAAPEETVSWDQFDDPEFDPATTAVSGIPTPASIDAAAGTDSGSSERLVTGRGHTVVLGPQGVDSNGVIGRVHQVVRGDTLWDISEAYLGTPWVWPSVWKDNRKIENPHVINPGDHIWITSNEMRPITPEEASALMAGGAQGPASTGDEELIEPTEDLEEVEVAEESFPADALDQLPIVVPTDGIEARGTGRTVRVSAQKTMGFVNDEELEAASAIVDSPSERIGLSLLDIVYIGLGEGEVSVGDRFTIFRDIDDVRHPRSGRLLGYYIDVVGWLEVTRIEGQTSVAKIMGSNAAALRGDRVIPRTDPALEIDVQQADDGLEGLIAFLPSGRTVMSTTDYVFLDVGASHGVQIGTDMEVYEPGRMRPDPVEGGQVRTPDRIVADLVVVNVKDNSSVAYVNQSRRGLVVGDSVRGATEHFPSAF